MALFTTFITTPLVMAVFKPARRAATLYKHRTIHRNDADSEFRVLACFHGSRNVPTMINLVESSRGTRKRRLTVYAMHLMELSERSSAISMVHKARLNGLPFWNKKQNGDQVEVVFQAFQQLSNVSIRPMTAISDLYSMHEDIIASAEQKRAALIVLPFHKILRFDGSMDSVGHGYQLVNQRVLQHAPCSVGVLIDRGLGGSAQVCASEVSYTVAVLYFGGRDDREALAYGVRMAEHPGIELTVMHFVPQPGQPFVKPTAEGSVGRATNASEQLADETCITDFQAKVMGANPSVMYHEKVVGGGKAEIAAIIKAMGRFNLFLIGHAPRVMPLTDRADCPELGPVGSYLAQPEFSASVMVISQYDPTSDVSMLAEVAEVHDLQEPDTPMT